MIFASAEILLSVPRHHLQPHPEVQGRFGGVALLAGCVTATNAAGRRQKFTMIRRFRDGDKLGAGRGFGFGHGVRRGIERKKN